METIENHECRKRTDKVYISTDDMLLIITTIQTLQAYLSSFDAENFVEMVEKALAVFDR